MSPFLRAAKLQFSATLLHLKARKLYLFLFLFEGRPEISRGNYIILKSEVDLDATGQVYQVGAHFKALGKGVLLASSDLRCIFFTSQTKPQERRAQ